MAFNIEKSVPIPTCYGSRKYPFDQMKPGDSFLINGTVSPDTIRQASVSFGRTHDQKFSVRKTPEGHRCWRIK